MTGYTICPGCGRLYDSFEGGTLTDPRTKRKYELCIECLDGENGTEEQIIKRCREYAAGRRTYKNYSLQGKYRPF